eukprot:12122498-Alexandrium_andersonii.AAC.1
MRGARSRPGGSPRTNSVTAELGLGAIWRSDQSASAHPRLSADEGQGAGFSGSPEARPRALRTAWRKSLRG